MKKYMFLLFQSIFWLIGDILELTMNMVHCLLVDVLKWIRIFKNFEQG